jgi:hypothetical protein
MAGIFGGTPTPKVVEAPAPPAIDTAAQAQSDEVARQQAIALRAGGRASTQLTGGLGDPTEPTTAKKQLMGQ